MKDIHHTISTIVDFKELKLKYLIEWSDLFISGLKKFVKEQTEDIDELIEDEGQYINFLCFFKLNDSEKSSIQYPNCRATEEMYG